MSRLSLWIPTLCMTLVSLISYIDRNTLAILAPTIREHAKMSEQDYGMVITAFSIAYMIGNPVWGWVLDRFGLRFGMTAAVAFWTAASAGHALANDFWGFAIARALLGFGEGATFPAGLRAVMQTLPATDRARGVAIAYSGGSLGAIVAPLIVTPILVHWGWHEVFLFTGLIGVAWLVLWQIVALRSDIRLPQYAAADASESTSPKDEAQQDRPSFFDRRSWAFMFAYALGGSPLAFILYYSASYLRHVFALSQESIGQLLWIPPLGWEVGYLFWGWVIDRAHRQAPDHASVDRKILILLTILSLPLALVPMSTALSGVMILKFFAMSIAGGFIIASLTYATHVYPPGSSGLIAGLGAGAWGAGVAVAMPMFGHLFDEKMFGLAFLIAAVLPSAGLLLWWRLSARK